MKENKQINKKLLVINYYFPPIGGAGVKRSLKFIKFLPLYGWDSIVLTVKNWNHSLTDYSLLQEVKSEVPVYRAFTLEYFFNSGIESSTKTIASFVDDNNSETISMKYWFNKIYKYFGQYIKIPDSRILWLPGATITGIKLGLTNRFDAIYATGPTFTSLIIGALLKIITRKPFIADFRDAWIGDPMLQVDKKYLMKIHSRLEKFVIHHADKVIATNPFVIDDFKKRYGELSHSRFDTIYNGFDVEDCAVIKEHKPQMSDKFTIVHTGRLYGERTPKYFLKSLSDALTERPDMRNKLQVIFVGPCEEFLDGKQIQDYLEEFNLNDVIEFTGQISRKESIEYQMRAHLLLLIIGIVPQEKELTYGIPGKIFDYFLSKKPILTLANGGASREFIVKNNIGSIYYHNDYKSIKDYLIHSYDRFSAGAIEKDIYSLSHDKFDFRVLTEKLAKHLNDTIKQKGENSGY